MIDFDKVIDSFRFKVEVDFFERWAEINAEKGNFNIVFSFLSIESEPKHKILIKKKPLRCSQIILITKDLSKVLLLKSLYTNSFFSEDYQSI